MLGTKKQRFEMLLEDIESNVKVIAEQSTIHSKKLEKLDVMEEDMQILKDDMVAVKTIVKQHSETLKLHSETLESIKADTTAIKNDLKEKVDRKEFVALEHRVLFLEQKLRHA